MKANMSSKLWIVASIEDTVGCVCLITAAIAFIQCGADAVLWNLFENVDVSKFELRV